MDQTAPDPVLAAAVWEDGSTFGTDDLLLRITNRRIALEGSYDQAIAALQTGLEKNWSAEDYLAAAQKLKPPLDARHAAPPETSTAEIMPSYTITVNMQRAARENQPRKLVDAIARSLLERFSQDRESLRRALSSSTASGDQAKK